NEIKCIGRDPLVIKETFAQARRQDDEQIDCLKAERVALRGRLSDDHAELGRLALAAPLGGAGLSEAHDRIRDAERRMTEIDEELASLSAQLIDPAEVTAALTDFDAVWNCLTPREQARVIELLIEEIAYDGDQGNITITFRATGIKTLAAELAKRNEEAA